MFSHDNYIKYGWDKGKFYVKYGRCKREPMSFRNECINAADLIYDSTEKKILIHFSGGIDSEVVCRSFLEAKHPFEVCIWKYEDGLNEHDIKYAIKFCKKYDIKYTVVELNIIEFIKQDLPNHHWWSNVSKHMIEQNDGYQILGDGHVNFNHDPLNASYIPPVLLHTRFYQGEKLEAKTYKVFAESQHADITSHMEEGCSGFFHYTPELMLSFIRDEYIQNWLGYCDLRNINPKKLYPLLHPKTKKTTFLLGRKYVEILNVNCTLDIRPFVKYKHWPELEFRPKYTGIDKIRPLVIKKLDEFGERDSYPQMVFIPADEFIEGLECI